MEGFRNIFQGVEDPPEEQRLESPVRLTTDADGPSSAQRDTGFSLFSTHKLELLRGFMPLKGGAPSHDAFSDLFNALIRSRWRRR